MREEILPHQAVRVVVVVVVDQGQSVRAAAARAEAMAEPVLPTTPSNMLVVVAEDQIREQRMVLGSMAEVMEVLMPTPATHRQIRVVVVVVPDAILAGHTRAEMVDQGKSSSITQTHTMHLPQQRDRQP